jgi:hypothetical protein
MLRGDDKSKDWNSCIEPLHPETSIYSYCDKENQDDFYKKSRCKTDMCNLCCVSFENKSSVLMTDHNIQSCYDSCLRTFNKISYN